MGESLGIATLTIETKDQGFSAGVSEAKGKAEALGGAMDDTGAKATRLGQQMGVAGGGATRFAKELNNAHQVSGSARAGMVQLSQQLGDVSTMFALGARPSQIFASQIGQVVQAVQLMTGGTSRLAAFLGGPWGIALTTATVVLAPLIGKLFETSSAMEKVQFASNAMGDAQGILGRVMDLTTGKINTQNTALIALARAQIAVAQIQSRMRMDEARNQISDMGTVRNRITGTMMGFGVERTGAYENQVTRDLLSGVNNTDEAVRRLQDMRASGKISEDTFVKLASSVANYGVEQANQKVYSQANDALNGKGLGSLAKTGGGSKRTGGGGGKSGPSAAEIEAEFEKNLSRLNEEELRAKLDMTTDAGERLAIQQQLLGSEREAKVAEVENNKKFTAAQKQAQIEVINRIYGKPGQVGADGITVDGRPGVLGQKLNRDFDREDARLKNDMLARQEETLRAQAQIAPDTQARAELERRALELHQEIERNLLEQEIATGQVADAEAARAELAKQQDAARTGQEMSNEGPLASYGRSLKLTRAARGQRIEGLIVDELDWVNQSIDNAIMGRLGVKDPLLAGLIDAFVKDVLIRPIFDALSQARGNMGGGGLFAGLFRTLLGGGVSAGTAARLAPDVAATMDSSAFAGLFAEGGMIPSGGWGIVGEAGPEPIFATNGGVGVLPNSALRQMGGGGQAPITFDLRGAVMTQDLLRQMNEIAASSTASGLRSYDRNVGDRAKENLARYG